MATFRARRLMGCLCAALAMCACFAEPSREESSREISRLEAPLTAAADAKPIEAQSELRTTGKPPFTVKAPPLRKATVDEVEELNETFRTEGSRDRVLRRIEGAQGENRQRLIAYYNSVAIRALAPADQAQARAKLSAALSAQTANP
ncbi:MAG TPA: hypothetical protein VFK05_35920 [Polyangiaceae bacterium]|nr:hypothetical protein [Polyangiaceae bacterium]